MITFEINDKKDELEIHLDKDGLKKLQKILEAVQVEKDLHLMTPSWGGNELDEDKQNISGDLINLVHLKFWE